MACHPVEIVVHWTKQDMAQSSESGSCSSSEQNRNHNEWSPSLNLLEERNEGNHQLRLGLLKAALAGNIEEAKRLINDNSSMRLTSAAITEGQETIFHVAAGAKQTDFVEKMIDLMTDNDLRLQNEKGNTAFCFAVMAGSESVAGKMLEKDPTLLGIRGGKQMTPLYLAALFGEREMALSLYRRHYKNNGILTGLDKKQIFFVSIDTTLYDLALELLNHDNENELATNSYMHGECPLTPLHRLALTPLHLLDRSSKSDLLNQARKLVQLLWTKILEKEGNQVGSYFNDHRDLLFDAAHLGNFIFLAELISIYPDLVHQKDDHQRTIFHIAIMHRYDDLFKLIHNIGFNKQLLASYLDKDNNSLLHLAAKYPNPKPVNIVPGAALEMQRELQIFKDVEMLVMPSFRELKNKNGKTPRELFTSTHEDLLKNGEKWMRDTASQCILVATIIATIAFPAAFNVPGGNNSNDGIPIHRRNVVYRFFVMADAIALSSSSISILMFLSILTSRYAENDFYRSLPLKLVVGVLTLFISIAAMMLAFIPSIFMAYDHHRSNVIPILATIFVNFPVFIFGLSQYGLLRDVLYHSFVHSR
ncbi:ankyrin repeat-containing protein ITN1-like [Mangifera indica]|uniref:ankyrin repeat-containing protein ITN1-like n=1 Tax=Mangifera indica TaxID=29780 RepID=UPI001CFB09C4|nr:ankyrin repeat-containing protein ITN1-like [Mangifera indica]